LLPSSESATDAALLIAGVVGCIAGLQVVS
jgi:hypothetical protein